MWEILEEAVAALYGTIIGTHSQAAMAAYGTVASGPGRMGMIVAAAEAEHTFIDKQSLSEVKSLLREIGELAARRNDIAHGTAAMFSGSLAQGNYLVPPRYNTRRQQSPRRVFDLSRSDEFVFGRFKYAYTAAQIDRYADHFWNYVEKVYDLHDKLTGLRLGKEAKRNEAVKARERAQLEAYVEQQLQQRRQDQ